MATYYVNSAATGTGDGSSFTNGLTTFGAAVAKLAAGDDIRVLAGTHTETIASATTYTFPGTPAAPNTVEWTDSNGNPIASSTFITAAGLTIGGSVVMTFAALASSLASSTSILLASTPAGVYQKYIDPTFSLTATGTSVINVGTNGGVGNCELVRPNFKFAGAGNSISLKTNATWTGAGSVSGVVPTALFTACASTISRFEGADLSFITTTIVGVISNGAVVIDLKDCKTAPGVVFGITPSVIGPVIQTSRTDSAGTNYKTNFITFRGTQSTETMAVRTNGASDGATSVSWKLATNAGVSWPSHFKVPPIFEWNTVTGTTRTATVRGIVNAASLPINDQIWIDIEGPADSASGLGGFGAGTKANILATGAALTADTSSWDGAAPARSNSTTYAVGAVIKLASNPGRLFFCTASSGATASSEPAGYASAVDGGSVTDGGATFRAGCRFLMTAAATFQQVGYIYVYTRVGAASSTFWIDPLVTLS